MSFPKALSALAISLAGAFPIAAVAAETIAVRDLVARALERNPSLAAARERVRAAEARPAVLGALPDPVLSWEAWNAPDSFAPNRADNNIFKLSQRLPFPGKLAAAANEEREAIGLSRAEVSVRELELIAAVKRAYAELWKIEESVRVHARDRAIARRLADRKSVV